MGPERNFRGGQYGPMVHHPLIFLRMYVPTSPTIPLGPWPTPPKSSKDGRRAGVAQW